MTSIEWTDETWNPITGCKKVSPGCANCYAEGIAKRFWGERKFTDVQFHTGRLDQPLRWRKPRMVFVNSMSDWLHDAVTDDQIFQMLGIASICRHHTFQFLTKRPERLAVLSSANVQKNIYKWGCYWADGFPQYKSVQWQWPLPNVWLGVTVENQATADQRIPLLLQTPAAVRFLSCEPLLEEVEIDCIEYTHRWGDGYPDEHFGCWNPLGVSKTDPDHKGIGWVIVGGESGPGARPCDMAWIRSIVEQCKAAGVPCFVKQLGSKPKLQVHDCHKPPANWADYGSTGKGNIPSEWPEYLRVRQMPSMGVQ